MAYRLSELVRHLGLELDLASDPSITGINNPQLAKADEITFVVKARYLAQLSDSAAAAVLLPCSLAGRAPAQMQELLVEDAYLAYALLSQKFALPKPAAGIASTAQIAASAQIDPSASIGHYVVIGEQACIGPDVVIGAHSVLSERVVIGANTELKPHVVCYPGVVIGQRALIHSGVVLGSDGFGYAKDDQRWVKIAQNGGLIIADDVEIGANSALDRGAIEDTQVGQGSKLDNLVHLAHNVRLGQHVALAAQVGIAGSTQIGDGVTVGGQAGFAGHLQIAANSHFTGQAMVTKGVSEAGVYSSGQPAKPNKEWRKTIAQLNRLEKLEQRIKELEAKLES